MALPHYHSSPSSSTYEYDVFLNFRGMDTRKNFTGHLYSALKNKGLRIFKDSKEILVGQEIGTVLLTAIKESQILIPVFSKEYAYSKWCLRELAEMLQCYQMNDQIILPVFFNVDPSDVRHQTGSFEEAFRNHERDDNLDPEIIQKWRKALKEVGSIKGWEPKEVENG